MRRLKTVTTDTETAFTRVNIQYAKHTGLKERGVKTVQDLI